MTDILDDQGVFWWRTSDPRIKICDFENSIAGRLVIAEDGSAALELHGVLSETNNFIHRMLGGESDDIGDSIIQGVLKTAGEQVILLGLYTSGGRASFGGMSYERYGAETCLVGHSKLPKSGELKFNCLDVDLKGYEEWHEINSIASRRTTRSLKVSYNKVKASVYDLAAGRKLAITSTLKGPYLGDDKFSAIELVEKIGIEIRSPTPVPVDTHLREYRNLCHFVYLLTGSEYNLEWPVLISKKRNSASGFFKVYEYRKPGLATPPGRHSSWLNLDDVKASFGQLYDGWREKQEKLGPCVGLFFGARRHLGLYAENRFVNLIWGLESLHRGCFILEGKAPMGAKADRILKAIIDTGLFNKSDRRFIKERFEGRFEPSLAERLHECIKDLDLPVDSNDLKAFCERCAGIRNDISHFGGRRPGSLYQSLIDEIIVKTEVVAVLYRALLLKETGLGSQVIRKVFTAGHSSRLIRRAFERAGVKILPV